MIKKDTYTREEVVDMLKEMQMETSKCVGFIVVMVTQAWVIRTMLWQKNCGTREGGINPELCMTSKRMDRLG